MSSLPSITEPFRERRGWTGNSGCWARLRPPTETRVDRSLTAENLADSPFRLSARVTW